MMMDDQIGGAIELTDQQLQELLRDPRFNGGDMALLSPGEQQRIVRLKTQPQQGSGREGEGSGEGGSMLRGLSDALTGGLTGAAKGLAEHTSNALNIVPGLRDLATDTGSKIGGTLSEILYGKEAVAQPVTTEQSQASLQREGTAEKVGAGAESIAEFFIPANVARKAAIQGLVRLIPDAASPGTMRVLNKAGAIIGRTIGEAGSAGAVADLQGEDAGRAAMIGATGPLFGEAGAHLASTLKNSAVRDIVPYLTAILTGAATGDVMPAIGAGALTGFGLRQKLVRSALQRPGTIPSLQKGMRVVGPAAARLAASHDPNQP